MSYIDDTNWVKELLEEVVSGKQNKNLLQACVDKMNRNHRVLYKYYDLNSEFTLPNLESFVNYYNNPVKFNDPFDCNIGISLDQVLKIILPIALHKCYPSWSKSMVETVTAISLNRFEVQIGEEDLHVIKEECHRVTEYREFEQCLAKGELIEDSKIARMLCRNPAILKCILMRANVGKGSLSEPEIDQLVDFCADLIMRMHEVAGINSVEEESVLDKVFAFFDTGHDFVDKIFEAAYLLGINVEETTIDQLRRRCGDEIKKIHHKMGGIVGITCFAQRSNNLLMWSHYANKHTGICVEYDFSGPMTAAPNSLLLPVEYTSMRPMIPIEKIVSITDAEVEIEDDKIGAIYPEILKALVTKSSIWEYEQEWRHIVFVKEEKDRLVHLPIISKIIMGVNISNDNRKIMIDYAKRNNISLYQAELKENQYEMVKTRVLF